MAAQRKLPSPLSICSLNRPTAPPGAGKPAPGKYFTSTHAADMATHRTGVMAYPWGDDNPDCTLANTSNAGARRCVGDTAIVGSFPDCASLYGLQDLAGNVSTNEGYIQEIRNDHISFRCGVSAAGK